MRLDLAVPAVAVAIAASGCGIPLRDNGNDPAVRPVAAVSVYVLEPAGPLSTGTLVVVDGGSYEAVVRDQGFSDDIFMFDASASSDPDDPESTLDYFWELAGVDLPHVTNPCPAGPDSFACRILRPADLAGLPRNAPIPLRVRVEDPAGHEDDEPVSARLLDVAPIAVAGPDWILPVSDDLFPVVLDGLDSLDPEGEPLATFCWEQVLPTDGPLAPTVVEPSQGTCPLTNPFWTVGRSIAFDASAAVDANGRPPLYRFRLHVRDAFTWSEPDVVDVQVGSAALWTIHDVPAIGERRTPGLFRLDVLTAGTPLLASSRDGTPAYVVSNTGNSSFSVTQVGVDGSVLTLQPQIFETTTGTKLFRAAVLEGTQLWGSVLWADVDTHMVSFTVVGSSLSGVVTTGSTGPAPNLLAADPAGGVWGALSGSDAVSHYTVVSNEVVRTTEIASVGSPVTVLEAGTDGTLYVGAENFLAVHTASGATIDVPGLRPTALRYEEGPLAGIGDDFLWIGDADRGIVYAPVVGLLSGTPAVVQVYPDIVDARFLRLSDDGSVWITRIGGGEVVRVDRYDGTPFGTFVMDAPILSAAGTSDDGGLLVAFPAQTASGIAVARIPRDAGELLGRTESAGSVRDVSTERDDGGAWVAFESPPSVAQVDSDGARHPATITSSLNGQSFYRPWRISADARSRGVWLAERGITSLLQDTQWHVATRAEAGTRGPLTSRGKSLETGKQLLRLRANGEDASGNLRAWGLEYLPGGSYNVVDAVEDGAGGITFSRLPIGDPGGSLAGPAVAPDGAGWFAICHGLGGFNPSATCFCPNPNDSASCQVNTRLAWMAPGGSTLTEFVPPSVDLGLCGPGDDCGLYPLDLAFDPQRNVLWLAVQDFQTVLVAPLLRFWRFSCTTGGPLQTCAPGDVVSHESSPTIPIPLTFSALTRLVEEGPDLLGVDEGTGLAYFLDPTDGDILVLTARTDPNGFKIIEVSQAARSTTARRIAIGR